MAADKAYWKNYGKPGYKSGGEILLEETPSNPSELRKYIEVVGVFSEDITSNDITSIYLEAVNLMDYWEKERPGNLDLIRAREKLKVVTKRVKKDKRYSYYAVCHHRGSCTIYRVSYHLPRLGGNDEEGILD